MPYPDEPRTLGSDDGDAELVDPELGAAAEAGPGLALGAAVDRDDDRVRALALRLVDEGGNGAGLAVDLVEGRVADELGFTEAVRIEAADFGKGPAGELPGIERAVAEFEDEGVGRGPRGVQCHGEAPAVGAEVDAAEQADREALDGAVSERGGVE